MLSTNLLPNRYFQSLREYVLSVVLAFLFSFSMPEDVFQSIQGFLIMLLTLVPLTLENILWVNLGTMTLILISELKIPGISSFFLCFNGFALGVLAFMYRGDFFSFLSLIFPHSFFEILLMIVFCSQVKILSLAYRLSDTGLIIRSWKILFLVCIPLWLMAGFLEATVIL